MQSPPSSCHVTSYQYVAGGGVSRHGLILERVGLNQLLLLPPLLLPSVVIVQLIQALREEEENDR